MKARDIYSSYLLIVGAMCLVLGIGNWIVGAVETTKYQNLLHKTAQTGLEETYRSFHGRHAEGPAQNGPDLRPQRGQAARDNDPAPAA